MIDEYNIITTCTPKFFSVILHYLTLPTYQKNLISDSPHITYIVLHTMTSVIVQYCQLDFKAKTIATTYEEYPEIPKNHIPPVKNLEHTHTHTQIRLVISYTPVIIIM